VFEVYDLGFRAQSLGFRVKGVGFDVIGAFDPVGPAQGQRPPVVSSLRPRELRPRELRPHQALLDRSPRRGAPDASHEAALLQARELFIHNLLVRIPFIIVMIRWTDLAPWKCEFPFPGSLISTFLEGLLTCRRRWRRGEKGRKWIGRAPSMSLEYDKSTSLKYEPASEPLHISAN